MNILCHPFDHQKIVYVEIPKAGCTTIKAGLAMMRGPFYFYRGQRDRFHRKFGYTRLPNLNSLWHNFDTIWADYFKFTVIRNPFKRFESLFYDKIAPSYNYTINEYVIQELNKSHWLIDAHGAPQTSLIGTDLKRYDFIGTIENFSETAKKLELFQIQFPSAILNARKNVRQEKLSHDALEVLRNIYSADFRWLGYPLEYPSA